MNVVWSCSCGAVGTFDTATLKTKTTPDETHAKKCAGTVTSALHESTLARVRERAARGAA